MPRTRNELGQFVKNDGGGHFNYMPIPSFYTIFLFSLGFMILYPWFTMLWELKQKIFNLFSFLMKMIPDDVTLDGSTSKKTAE
jgi:hypothetical protein